MSSHIDFYFDIISPYAYIAHKKIQKIKDIKFIYKPILLGGLHNLAEITAPAFNKYKMKNMQSDCVLVSKKNNISFQWNSKFPINSLSIMRGYLCIDDNQKEEYLDVFFNAYWVHGDIFYTLFLLLYSQSLIGMSWWLYKIFDSCGVILVAH